MKENDSTRILLYLRLLLMYCILYLYVSFEAITPDYNIFRANIIYFFHLTKVNFVLTLILTKKKSFLVSIMAQPFSVEGKIFYSFSTKVLQEISKRCILAVTKISKRCKHYKVKLHERKSLIILDEIQLCPRARVVNKTK